MGEETLMPRSFVEQALARCSVEGAKFWFNCNPDVPEHWFRREWLLKLAQKDATHLHFTLDDKFCVGCYIKKSCVFPCKSYIMKWPW